MAKKYIGIDIGSTASKVCVLEEGKDPVYDVLPTGWNSKITAGIIKDDLIKRYGDIEDADIIATGYGRISVEYADSVITEITCHGRGGYEMIGRDCTIIDIGGQDTKYINVKNGRPVDFLMNDKCAAGTGRFYEAMARSFEMTLPEFSKLSLTAKNVIPITAQCTVFAESEVITLVGEDKPMDEIAAGIQMAVAKRCFVMAKKAGATDSITLTGGCAKNDGLKDAIEHVLKLKVINLKTDPQLMGALGAAEFARQKGQAK